MAPIARLSGTGRIIDRIIGQRFLWRIITNQIIRPSLRPDNPAPRFLQRLQTASFEKWYKYPLHLQPQVSLTRIEERPFVEPPNLRDLLLPPKFVDLWRIEGEDLDLRSYPSDLLSPLIHLRGLSLGFPLGEPRPPFSHLLVFVAVCVIWEPPIW